MLRFTAMNSELRQRLLEMAEEERRLHAELSETGELFQGYAPRMEKLNREQALELEGLIEKHGWPGESLVGADGAHAAWITAQHGISLPAFQRKCLGFLQAAAARGEASLAAAAFLEDKIHFFERKPQRYGTQFDWDENRQLSPWTLEDPARVDEYRQSVGLGPLSDQIQQFRRDTGPEHCPADWKAHQEEMLAWARSVGWL